MLSTTNTLKNTNYAFSLNAAGEKVAFQTAFLTQCWVLQAAQFNNWPCLSLAPNCDVLGSQHCPSLLLNTLICSLKNKEVETALWKAEKRDFFFTSETIRISFSFPWHFTNCNPEPWASCLLLRALWVQWRETQMRCRWGCSHHRHFQCDLFLS